MTRLQFMVSCCFRLESLSSCMQCINVSTTGNRDGVEFIRAHTVRCSLDAKRNHMLLSRSPGPYEDKWGPLVLGSLFVAAIMSQILIKITEKKWGEASISTVDTTIKSKLKSPYALITSTACPNYVCPHSILLPTPMKAEIGERQRGQFLISLIFTFRWFKHWCPHGQMMVSAGDTQSTMHRYNTSLLVASKESIVFLRASWM